MRNVIRRPWSTALPIVLLGLAVGCADSTEPEAAAEAAGCVSNLEFFQKEVSVPVLEKRCAACHTADGLARNSKLVLAGPTESNYLAQNLAAIEEVARYEYEGESILLLKPLNTIAHGGGQQLEVGTPEYQALVDMVARLEDPPNCATADGGDKELLEKIVVYELDETVRHAKVQLLGELPTDAEVNQVREGGADAFRALAAQWMTQERFLDTVRMWLNERFLTDKYLGGENALSLLDDDDYPTRRYYNDLDKESDAYDLAKEYANNTVAREALDLIAYVIREDRPFTEILTADYMVVNPFSAKVYGLDTTFSDETNPDEWKEAKLPAFEHAGVLTSAMFLNRFPTTDTNLNRHRAAIVLDFFLATDILKKAAERPVDSAEISDHNPTMNNPMCAVCHSELDPVAGAFQNWDDQGRYRPLDEGWPQHLRPPGFGEAVIPPADWPRSLSWLGQRLANDDRFAVAAVRMAYLGLVGRMPVDNPTDPDDPRYEAQLTFFTLEQQFLTSVAEAFVESGYNFKTIVTEIMLSPYYRAESLVGDLEQLEQDVVSELGTAQLLTPERLHDRILAVTGYPWRYRVDEADRLLDEGQFLFFYGGIDSDDVTRRIQEPNGMIANIGIRMAAEMGCLLAPREFSMEPSDRRLLMLAEPSYQPEDENGFTIPEAVDVIKANIQYLHRHILGEDLTPGHPQLEATYALFYETWKEGKTAMQVEDSGVESWMEGHCQARRDFWSDAELPEEQQVREDPNYTIRAWSAVLTYLLSDYRFLYQ